jgi:hypothetical protein
MLPYKLCIETSDELCYYQSRLLSANPHMQHISITTPKDSVFTSTVYGGKGKDVTYNLLEQFLGLKLDGFETSLVILP